MKKNDESLKHTTFYHLIGEEWRTNNADNMTKAILGSSQFIRDMISACDMFRIKYADYYITWYKNGKKARLTISKGTL